MWRAIIETRDDRTALLLRLTLGIVIFPHGAQKLLGWFGGPGVSATMQLFTETFGVPATLAALVIGFEFFGALALALGLLSRLAALGIACIMVVATLMVHLPQGFFMNWSGVQRGEGFEYHLLALAIALVVMIKGSGTASLDRYLATAIRSPRPATHLVGP